MNTLSKLQTIRLYLQDIIDNITSCQLLNEDGTDSALSYLTLKRENAALALKFIEAELLRFVMYPPSSLDVEGISEVDYAKTVLDYAYNRALHVARTIGAQYVPEMREELWFEHL